MKKIYLCPKCHNELEEINACGAQSFFCDTCKSLVSRKNMIDPKKEPDENSNHVKE